MSSNKIYMFIDRGTIVPTMRWVSLYHNERVMIFSHGGAPDDRFEIHICKNTNIHEYKRNIGLGKWENLFNSWERS